MPTYEYHCDACDTPFEKVLPMSRSSEEQECPECGTKPARKKISAGVGFILRGDGWTGKNNRISGQMRKKNQALDKKQEERKRDAGMRLAPNVGGERTESWSDAAKLAKSQGKDTTGYDKRAAQEKK